MIAYFDTSALVPLLVTEAGTDAYGHLWDHADQVVSVRLTYVEAAAAVARAHRLGRVNAATHAEALQILDALWSNVVVIEVDEALMHAAAVSAGDYGLRGYDAVHCAAAFCIAADDLVAATGDRPLLAAWAEIGLTTFDAGQW